MERPTLSECLAAVPHPHAVVLGTTFAFLGCCLAGHLCSRHNPFRHFVRFYPQIAPESLFYPTASQVCQLARSRLDPNKVAVIVGGNSITRGAGQSVPGLWTRKLQRQLGEQYQVLNLAMNGATEAEFGALAAEILAQEGRKVVLVTDIAPGVMQTYPDGCTYNYFFWDAYYKRLMRKYPERQLRLRLNEASSDQSSRGKHLELRRGRRLDSSCYFQDLWTTLAYNRLATVWNYLLARPLTTPRRVYPDQEYNPVPPLAQRYVHFNHAAQMSVVRGWIATGLIRNKGGQWVEDPKSPMWESFKQSARDCFPGEDRQRTIMLVTRESPYYLDQLTPQERARYDAMVQVTLGKLAELGFTPSDGMRGMVLADYQDRCHLEEVGGQKLAAALAPQIKELSRRLGYLR